MEEATWLALKMEERAMSKQSLETGKGKVIDFPLEPPEEMQLYQPTSELQTCKKSKVVTTLVVICYSSDRNLI